MENNEQKTDETKNVQEAEVVGNEVTAKILGKRGVNVKVAQDDGEEREQKSKDESAVETKEQVTDNSNEEFIDITDADLKSLEEAGIPEKELVGKSMEEIKEMAQNLQKKQEDTTTSQEPEKVIISDAYAEQLAVKYPFAKSLKGKTMEEVMEIIQNQNSYISQKEREIQEAKDTNTNSQKTETNEQETEQITFADLLDPMLDPKEANAKFEKMIQQKADAIADKKVADRMKGLEPQLKGLEAQQLEREEKLFYDTLQGKLPEGSDAKQVFKEWKDTSKLSVQEKVALTAMPNVLIDLIAQSYNFRKTSTEKKTIEANKNNEIKKETYNNLRKLLKSNKQVKGAKFNYTRDSKVSKSDLDSEDGSAGEQMIGKILKKRLNR